jgi:S1-C subfamily serine protease
MDSSIINNDTILNAVVRVEVHNVQFDWIEPYKNVASYRSVGTGFFINSTEILTCAHVIDKAIRIWVYLPTDNSNKIETKVKSICPSRDIALLEPINYKSKNFLHFDNSDKIKYGIPVIAIGYPMGQTGIKFTQGVLSGRHKQYLQVDTPINKGNSGGPLMSTGGNVLGIISQKVVSIGSDNIGYVVPVTDIKNSMKTMRDINGIVHVPHLGFIPGVSSNEYYRYIQRTINNGENSGETDIINHGCYVKEIFDTSPLKLGPDVINYGDIILSINGYQIDNNGKCTVPWSDEKIHLSYVMYRYNPNDTMKIEYISSNTGNILTKQITFTNEPIFLIRKKYPVFEDVPYEILNGIVLMDLSSNHIGMTDKIATNQYIAGMLISYGMPKGRCNARVVVTDVLLGSDVSSMKKVDSGDILSCLNDIPVTNITDVRKVLGNVDNEFIKLTFESGDILILKVSNILAEEQNLMSTHKYKSTKAYDILNTNFEIPKRAIENSPQIKTTSTVNDLPALIDSISNGKNNITFQNEDTKYSINIDRV